MGKYEENLSAVLGAIKKDRTKLNARYLAGIDPAHETFSNPIIDSIFFPLKKYYVNLQDDKVKKQGLTPPTQPLMIMGEGDNLAYEPLIYDWYNVFAGTGGHRLGATKLSEKFYYTEASTIHGTMLQKITFQRNQAKEMLASIQNIKTAVINIESDLEKLEEQMKAFKEGDWNQIKGLFVDNYGGPQRSWTATARNVPLVRMAMTWFLRLKVEVSDETEMPIKEFSAKKIREFPSKEKEDPKEKKKNSPEAISKEISELKEKIDAGSKKNKEAMLAEIDQLVKDEQVNPAVGNYLKRKIEEFWNWVPNYVDWLTRSKNRIDSNKIQQKANLKMYMRWASDHITQADRMEMDTSLEMDLPEFAFKGAPREAMKIDYLFYADRDSRPDIAETTLPWVPVFLTTFVGGTTIDVQKKFTMFAFINYYGCMKMTALDAIRELAKTNGTDLTRQMIEAGAMTDDELPRIFTREELDELNGNKKEEKKKGDGIFEKISNNVQGILSILGLEMSDDKNLPAMRKLRAGSIAADMVLRMIDDFKKAHGMLVHK